MTVDEVLARVEYVRASADVDHDDEVAHSMEDGLHRDVLQAIADGSVEDPAVLAATALRTRELRFSRWYA